MLVGKTIHDAEKFYVVVEGQVVINAVKIIEALLLTCSQFYIFNIEYYQDNIASWQFIKQGP
jgi:cell division septal protein FtsQ